MPFLYLILQGPAVAILQNSSHAASLVLRLTVCCANIRFVAFSPREHCPEAGCHDCLWSATASDWMIWPSKPSMVTRSGHIGEAAPSVAAKGKFVLEQFSHRTWLLGRFRYRNIQQMPNYCGKLGPNCMLFSHSRHHCWGCQGHASQWMQGKQDLATASAPTCHD